MTPSTTFLTLQPAQVTHFESMLEDALTQVALVLDAGQKRQLLLYLDKLLTWNKAYNLTAIKVPKEALIKHVFDCLAVVPLLKSGSLLDIGTGAGLPSVIVAICQPNRQVTALDSNQKKIRFIRQVISDLNISNVTAVASRIEDFDGKFDVITSRAFASLQDFIKAAKPFISTDDKGDYKGCLQAMKGVAPSQDEIKQVCQQVLPNNCTRVSLDKGVIEARWQITVIPLAVPLLADSRHMVEITCNNVD